MSASGGCRAGHGWDRIALGTVQLGLPYGRRAARGPMSPARARDVLDAAWALGVRHFDTAEAYGDAAERLAAWLAGSRRLAEAHVVTKVPLDAGPADVEHAVRRFPGVASLTLLTHGSAPRSTWLRLRAEANARGAEAGESVYGPDEVARAVARPGIARVQAPGSAIDERALTARGAARVPLDLRSVYLQGVLLDGPEAAEARLPGAGRVAAAVRAAATEEGEPAAALLAAAALRMGRPGDRIVVGVDHPRELKPLARAVVLAGDPEGGPGAAPGAEIIGRFRARVALALGAADIERLLDPRRWRAPDQPAAVVVR